MEDDFTVNGCLENGTARLQFIAEGGCVDEVAVVGDGQLTAGCIYAERLGV
jgi:deoxyxylulose-5-phosphate synthase